MRFAIAACVQKYGNVSFVTVACVKCMRYGGGWGIIPLGGGGGVGIRDSDHIVFFSGIFFGGVHFFLSSGPLLPWFSGLLVPRYEDT